MKMKLHRFDAFGYDQKQHTPQHIYKFKYASNNAIIIKETEDD